MRSRAGSPSGSDDSQSKTANSRSAVTNTFQGPKSRCSQTRGRAPNVASLSFVSRSIPESTTEPNNSSNSVSTGSITRFHHAVGGRGPADPASCASQSVTFSAKSREFSCLSNKDIGQPVKAVSPTVKRLARSWQNKIRGTPLTLLGCSVWIDRRVVASLIRPGTDSGTRGILTANRGQGSGSANTSETTLPTLRGPPVRTSEERRSGVEPSPHVLHWARIISSRSGFTTGANDRLGDKARRLAVERRWLTLAPGLWARAQIGTVSRSRRLKSQRARRPTAAIRRRAVGACGRLS